MKFAPSGRSSLNPHRDLTPSFNCNAESKPRSPAPFGILLLDRTGHDPHYRAYATNRLSARGHSHFDYARLLNYIVAIYLIISGVLGLGLFH